MVEPGPAGAPVDDAVLARLEAGELTVDEQQHLATALRADPALRRRLRERLALSALLVRAAQPPAGDAPVIARGIHRAPAARWWGLAAAALLVLGLGAVGIAVVAVARASPGVPGEQAAVDGPPTAVAATGPFTLDTRRGALVLPGRAQVDLEAGSSGDVSHPSVSADGGAANMTPAVLRLDRGGARLRAGPAGGTVQVVAGQARITVQGETAVRYLDVPDGAEPAVEVAVATGSAQVEMPGGKRHELHVGDRHMVAPGGTLKARIARADARLGTVQITAGPDRRRWTITAADAPPVVAGGSPFAFNRLEDDWKLVLLVDPSGAITRIEVPSQSFEAMLVGWDGATRTLLTRRGQQPPEEWVLAPGLASPAAQIGQNARLTFDPATRVVGKLSSRGRDERKDGKDERKEGERKDERKSR